MNFPSKLLTNWLVAVTSILCSVVFFLSTIQLLAHTREANSREVTVNLDDVSNEVSIQYERLWITDRDLEAAQRLAKRLRATVLIYRLGAEQSRVFVISQTQIAQANLPRAAVISDLVWEFRERITKPPRGNSPVQVKAIGSNLYSLLLAPIADHLLDRRVVIVADEILNLLPFAALPMPDSEPKGFRYFGEIHTITEAPSLSRLGLWAHRGNNKMGDLS